MKGVDQMPAMFPMVRVDRVQMDIGARTANILAMIHVACMDMNRTPVIVRRVNPDIGGISVTKDATLDAMRHATKPTGNARAKTDFTARRALMHAHQTV